MPSEQLLPELEVETTVGMPAKCILYNDDWHTFDEVIVQIVKATGCSIEDAERLTWEVHTNGKAAVYEERSAIASASAAFSRRSRSIRVSRCSASAKERLPLCVALPEGEQGSRLQSLRCSKRAKVLAKALALQLIDQPRCTRRWMFQRFECTRELPPGCKNTSNNEHP